MASKFQNRLVGTVILVAVGVIVLPGLLDGKKKHYKEEFAAIPLVPKPDDQQDSEMVPPVTQSLPAQPPEGAGAAVEGENGKPASGTAENGSEKPVSNSPPTVVTPPPVQQSAPVKPKPVETPKPKPIEQPKAPAKPVEQPKPVEKPRPVEEKAPAGQAWVVQLGALKNAAKVNEIVAQLRLSGYRAYTVPATPVQGQITRIFVGPDASKSKMQSAVGELKGITGLSGVVKSYSVR
ncbi:cell division protein DedD [[Erwinia] mediterraneensis]|uniref:cell division protein DedD n=1 Tax=[Erwinia] mediterraneensis TaxID=2161819 RepID=UPI001030C936|nr:cell division protein DedD [[Erwinia] mediterraneensis]